MATALICPAAAICRRQRGLSAAWSGWVAGDRSPDQAQPSLADYAVPGSRGAVIVAPGGGYRMKADHEGAPIAEMINEAGISAFVLDYRVAPCDPYAPLSDIKRAVRVVRAMGYEKVAVLGLTADFW